MATVPTGYVFWDVSANKSYAAGTTFPTLGNGDYLVPATSSQDGYYQQYHYYTSYTYGGITYTNCWQGTTQAAYSSLAQKLPFNSIADKPVRFFRYIGCQFTTCPTTTNTGGTSSISAITNLEYLGFDNCTKMTTAPVLPTGLKSLFCSFYNTKITSPPSNFSSLTNLQVADYCFYNCTSLTSAPTISGLTALTSAIGMFYDCTALVNPPVLPANVLDIGYMFYGCTSLTSGPTIPSHVTSIYGMFQNCTSLVGNIRIESEVIANSSYAFNNTAAGNQIILLGPSNVYSSLKTIAKSGNNGNVYAGIMAKPLSFTAIRGTYNSTTREFSENVSGTYCKLTIDYSAPYVSGALILPPTLSDGTNTLNPTWYINTLNGTALTSSGSQCQSSGALVTVLSLGSSETSATFTLSTNTKYTYNSITYTYTSSNMTALLTYSNLIIDVNPAGTAIAFGMEAPDDSGFYIDNDLYVNGDNEYLSLDTSVGSGTDFELRTAINSLAWGEVIV